MALDPHRTYGRERGGEMGDITQNTIPVVSFGDDIPAGTFH
jgi:hypothetical protein